MFLKKERRRNPTKWLKKVVNGKHLSGMDLAEALCLLGSCYQYGWGVEYDMTSVTMQWDNHKRMVLKSIKIPK